MSSTLVQSTSQSSSYKNTLGASYRQISHTFLPFSGFVLGQSWEEWPLPVRSIANFLKFSNSLKRKCIHRRGPFLQNLFVNPIAVFEWFEYGCRFLCGKISTCLGYFRVIILCFALFVIDGHKQNATSLLTPVSNIVFMLFQVVPLVLLSMVAIKTNDLHERILFAVE